jgi:2-methylisocitrate lyase-like PEP mutase family enzyme
MRADSGSDAVLVGAGAHDALTARLVEAAQFDLVWLGSLEVSARFCVPDRNLLTISEMDSVVREVRTAVSLPLYVDCDNGYGSDLNAVRAVKVLEASGAAAICVEDNAFPKRNSLELGEHAVVETEEFAKRLEQMTAARENLKIIARTEALVAGLGPAAAVARLRRYAETGVDGLFFQVNSSCKDQLFPVLEEVAGLLPITLAPTALPEVPLTTFAELGVHTVVFANVVARGIVGTLSGLLTRLKATGRLADVDQSIAPVKTVLELAERPRS